VGAEYMHDVMIDWLAALGHDDYKSVESPGSRTLTSTSGASSPV